MNPTSRPHPLLLGLMIAILIASWSLNFIAVKIGVRYLSPLALVTFRVQLATLLLLVIYAVSLLAHKSRGGTGQTAGGRSLHLDRRDFGVFVSLGFFGVVINQVFFTVGLSRTLVSHSSLIVGMGPIFVLLLAWLQGLEALTPKKLLGMAAAFSGVAILAAEHGVSLHSATLLGDFIAFCGTFGFAIYTVLSKRVADRYEPLAMNAANYVVGALLLLPLTAREALRIAALPGGFRSVAWQAWTAIVFMAVFASVVAYLIYFWALRYATATRIASFLYVQPVVTTALGIAWLGDRFTTTLLLGGALILAGVYIIESARPESPR